MRKFLQLTLLLASLLTTNHTFAQPAGTPYGDQDEMMFNHLDIGLELGTTGIGLEVAMPCTKHVALRTGFSIMPPFSYSTDIDFKTNKDKREGTEHNVNVKAKLHMVDWKLLADYYPTSKGTFHLTAGFFLGTNFPVRMKNTEDIDVEEGEGLEIGKNRTFIRPYPDEHGIVKLNMATNKFKPYLGIGFGRAIPKRRVNCAFDLGAQFWGKPCLKAYSYDEEEWVKVLKGDVGEDDFDDALDIIKKIVVYPVLSIRVNFRAF